MALFLAAVMLAATIGADRHAHVPRAEPGQGTVLRAADEDFAASCTICRLSHQAASIAIAPPMIGAPATPGQPASNLPPTVTSTGIEPSSSPRAPPRPASC